MHPFGAGHKPQTYLNECPCCLGKFDFANQIEYSDGASGQSKEYCPFCNATIFNDWSGFHQEDGKFKREHLTGQKWDC